MPFCCKFKLILDVLRSNVDFEIIVVDDNSPDGTQDTVRELQKIYGEKYLILKPRAGKLGLGTAYLYGLQYSSGNFVILMDADLSHHPKYISSMIKQQLSTKCDIVSGSRYIKNGGVYGWDFKRKLVSRGANILASTFLASGVSDLTGSFRLYKKEVLGKLIKDVKSKGYAFQMEIIVRAQRHRLKITEVPIVFVDRIYGESKLGQQEIVQFAMGLLKLFFTV